jgi:hypothetical protein
MNPPTPLTFSQAWDILKVHPFRGAEVPVEHAVSLPMPTHRGGGPGFAQFAAPCVRQPGANPVQSAPDRWWVLDATTGAVRLFARTDVIPFGTTAFARQELPTSAPDLATLLAWQKELFAALDATTGPFFAGPPADPTAARDLLDKFTRQTPAPLVPLYRDLAPDFFAWLENAR